MAYRKVNDNSLVSVADAIRSKGGTSDALVFPDGFVSAISAIQTGGGEAKETWVIKSSAAGVFATTQISFTSNGQKFTSIGANSPNSRFVLYYGNEEVAGYDPGVEGEYIFYNEADRKLTFDTPPTGDLLTWLQSNAVKQPNNTAVQDTKALTITSNGTVSVTPDVPYDGLSSVDVTVNVASGGGGSAGFKVTFPATATNWGEVDPSFAFILLADGTIKSVEDYSTICGKTIENVAGIQIKSMGEMFVLRMTLSAGGIAQVHVNQVFDITSSVVTTAPNATPTWYYSGRNMFWWPVADTVISSIEMYNTD